MMKQLMLPALAALGLALAAQPVQAFPVYCACEHYGSPYDGICEAGPQTGGETFTWQPWGSAWLPYPTDPESGFAYYHSRPGRGGGLSVTVYRASTGEYAHATCAFHTGGG